MTCPRLRRESRVGKVSGGIWELGGGGGAVGAEGGGALGAGVGPRVGVGALPQGQDLTGGVGGESAGRPRREVPGLPR